jgi:hypothetical protein
MMTAPWSGARRTTISIIHATDVNEIAVRCSRCETVGEISLPITLADLIEICVDHRCTE